MKNVNQPRLPVQQLGLLQLSSLGRDLHKGGTGAALLRPTVAKLAVKKQPHTTQHNHHLILIIMKLIYAHTHCYYCY
jgi:hypothetical protein